MAFFHDALLVFLAHFFCCQLSFNQFLDICFMLQLYKVKSPGDEFLSRMALTWQIDQKLTSFAAENVLTITSFKTMFCHQRRTSWRECSAIRECFENLFDFLALSEACLCSGHCYYVNRSDQERQQRRHDSGFKWVLGTQKMIWWIYWQWRRIVVCQAWNLKSWSLHVQIWLVFYRRDGWKSSLMTARLFWSSVIQAQQEISLLTQYMYIPQLDTVGVWSHMLNCYVFLWLIRVHLFFWWWDIPISPISHGSPWFVHIIISLISWVVRGNFPWCMYIITFFAVFVCFIVVGI